MLNAGSAASRPLALKRLELLQIIKQVDTHTISAELATEQLNALAENVRTVDQLPPKATIPLFQRAH
ncbi:hypothetical protein E3T61_21205 [Cryobacterium lactosi]|uniref:Uncharacterized protein n=1 Tax=Cryobacterium lactosi TaxID=1259202 RepID=A0A4R9BGH1_9MICO|nr:hypothetical protein [Cryobacterium lactosi]TFD83552.1 hypothetical protein E3T61_21205 [Cryobacterium lactosi]